MTAINPNKIDNCIQEKRLWVAVTIRLSSPIHYSREVDITQFIRSEKERCLGYGCPVIIQTLEGKKTLWRKVSPEELWDGDDNWLFGLLSRLKRRDEIVGELKYYAPRKRKKDDWEEMTHIKTICCGSGTVVAKEETL